MRNRSFSKESRPESRIVKTSEIICDPVFYPGYFCDVSPAELDFSSLGFVHNLIVLESEKKICLVSGGKRLSVMLDNSVEKCCVSMYKDLDKEDIITIFLHENRHRFINCVESANIASYCGRANIQPGRYIKSRMKPEAIFELSDIISNLCREHRDFLAANPIPFNDMEMLIYFPSDVRVSTLGVLGNYKINGHKMKAILDNLYRAGLKSSYRGILSSIEGMGSTEEIIRYLYSLNNPFLEKKRKCLEECRDAVKKRYKMEIEYDDNFEDPKFSISLAFGNTDGLSDLRDDECFKRFISSYIEFRDD